MHPMVRELYKLVLFIGRDYPGGLDLVRYTCGQARARSFVGRAAQGFAWITDCDNRCAGRPRSSFSRTPTSRPRSRSKRLLFGGEATSHARLSG